MDKLIREAKRVDLLRRLLSYSDRMEQAEREMKVDGERRRKELEEGRARMKELEGEINDLV